MATEWKKIFIDLRAIKYDSARLFLRQLENTLDLTKWINEGIAAGEINALSSFTLNGLTPTTQTFTTTTNGTNFTISSVGSVHSFNLPVASATNTGKLSAADWIRFDAGIVPVLGDLLSNSNAANIIGGTNAVIGGNVTIDFNAADAADDGILLSSDFNTFSAKLGSASNGLTVTSTLVEFGGPLTKNTTISGAFNLGFTNSRIGFGTASPASLVNTVTALTNQTDGTTSLNSFGFGYEQSATGYTTAFVNTANLANANGALFRIARSSSDAIVANFLYGGTTSALFVRGDGRIGINTITPSAWFDVKSNFVADSTIAQFGGTTASIISLNYGSTNDFSNIKIGNDFTLHRNGGSNPSINTAAMLEIKALSTYIRPVSGDSGTLNIQSTNNGGGGRARLGAYNTASSILNIGNTYNGGGGEFFYIQDTIFRNGKVMIADTNTETRNSFAILELVSTTKAFLLPRMTTVEKNAITAANGMQVYDTTTNKFCGYAAGAWVDLH